MRLVDVMDDTVALQKTLLAEIALTTKDPKAQKFSANPSLDDDKDSAAEAAEARLPLADVALHNNGAKFLLRLLAPDNSKYQGPHICVCACVRACVCVCVCVCVCLSAAPARP